MVRRPTAMPSVILLLDRWSLAVGLQTIGYFSFVLQVRNMRWAACAEQKTRHVHHSWSRYASNSYANGLHYWSFSVASKQSNVCYHSEMRYQQIDCLRLIVTQNMLQSYYSCSCHCENDISANGLFVARRHTKKYYKHVEMSHDKHYTIVSRTSSSCRRNARL